MQRASLAAVACLLLACVPAYSQNRPSTQPATSPTTQPGDPVGRFSGTVPRADWMGVNLEGPAYYGRSCPFIDAARSFSGWFGTDRISADGYPLAGANAICNMQGYPAGTYTLTYEGTATVTAPGYKLQNLRQDGKRTTAEVLYPMSGKQLRLSATKIDPANPLRNLHLFCPGYGPDSTEVFRPEFLRTTRPFGWHRYMDWGCTNNNEAVTWDQRIHPGDWDWTNNRRGLPYEVMIAHANATHRDMWVNVPTNANDDYVRQMADLFRDTLLCDINVHLEYSNEVWNNATKPWKANFDLARADNMFQGKVINGKIDPSQGTNDNVKAARRYAERARQIGLIWKQEFGAARDRVRLVLAGQTGGLWWLQSGLEWNAAKFGEPGCEEIAIAPYVYPFHGENPQTPADLLASMQHYLDATTDTDKQGRSFAYGLTAFIRQHRDLADQYHVVLVAYESGQHLVPGPSVTDAQLAVHPFYLVQRDPGMAALYTRLMKTWLVNGGSYFGAFSHIGQPTKWGAWGLMESLDDFTSPKWRVTMDACMWGGFSMPADPGMTDGAAGTKMKPSARPPIP